MELNLVDLIQWVWLAPLAFIWREVSAVRERTEHVAATRPTREEMEKFVAMSTLPTEEILRRVENKLDRLEQKLDEQARRDSE